MNFSSTSKSKSMMQSNESSVKWLVYMREYELHRVKRTWLVRYCDEQDPYWQRKTQGRQIMVTADTLFEAYEKAMVWYGNNILYHFDGFENFDEMTDQQRDEIAERELSDIESNDNLWLEFFNATFL